MICNVIWVFFLEFVKNDSYTNALSLAALEHFIGVGETIRHDPSFESGRLNKFDTLLANKNVEIHKLCRNRIVDASLCFIALAAPSMEGKTQSAFVLRQVKPLYFSLSTLKLSEVGSKQPIYDNFCSLTSTLSNCIDYDWDIVKTGFQAGDLKLNKADVDLFTLGFLMKLVEETKNMPQDANWMRFHATRPDFNFPSAKIGSVPEGYFKDYCLFLDEFIAEDKFIFLRNLARAIGLTCVVSNTNTKIANVVGRFTSSGGSGFVIWSIVIRILDPVTINFLNSVYSLDNLINRITVARPQNDPISVFLIDFRDNQLKHLRPGVAIFVVKAIKSLVDDHQMDFGSENVKFGDFMDVIVRTLADNLMYRKPLLAVSSTAFLGKLALLLPESYSGFNNFDHKSKNRSEIVEMVEEDEDESMDRESSDSEYIEDARQSIVDNNDYDYVEEEEKFFNQKRFLENHLFYLTNPQQDSSWIFPTIAAGSESSNKLLVYSNGFPENWDFECTEFNPNETLTILGCLFIPFKTRISRILVDARTKQKAYSSSISDSLNLKSAKFEGNPFEVSCAASIVDATHRIGKLFSFNGQSGTTFIKNLIFNLILGVKPPPSINVNIGPEVLSLFLASMKVPYLYSIDHESEFFNRFSSFTDHFYTKMYVRTSDAQQIDGKFSCFVGNQESNVICECKNRKKRIKTGILVEIIKKAINVIGDVKLILVFCSSLVNYTSEDSEFYTTCLKQKINAYRIEKLSIDVFNIVPFADLNESDANYHCIVVELDRVNKTKI